MADTKFDLIVVGGGPGGYVAAIRAAQLGLKTAVVEREHLGGICLNWGCIPTKALLRTADLKHDMERAEEFGLSVGEITFDLDKVVARSREVAGQLSGGVKHLLKKNKVTVIDGAGKLTKPGVLDVAGTAYEAPHILFATGARARDLPDIQADGDRIWNYKTALQPPRLPKRLLVIGSGAIGVEFASFYNALDVEVTVVEVMPRILPAEDHEIAALAHKIFNRLGLDVRANTSIEALERVGDGLVATLKTADKVEDIAFDHVILAVGISGNHEDTGLAEAGVEIDRGHVVVDGFGRTNVEGVYAIGDLTGPPWLAHKASHEGITCVEKIAGVEGVHPFETGNIPGCTFCRPQIASVGMTEEQAKEQGLEVRIGRFSSAGNGKSIAMGENVGLIKTIFDQKTGELLGAHMVGAEVTELIQGFVIARGLETTEAELMHTVFPHPTLSEMMHEAVLDAYGRTIHF
ncbi:MAG: dihydrolipoyl dehydrogenase [Alphaproteobacteria bacterium]